MIDSEVEGQRMSDRQSNRGREIVNISESERVSDRERMRK